VADAQYIGLTKWRDAMPAGPANMPTIKALYNSGVSFIGLPMMLSPPGTTNASVADNITCAKILASIGPGSIFALEGPNEPSNNTFTFGAVTVGASWSPVSAFQSAYYTAVKADPVLSAAGALVTTPTLVSAEADNRGLQYLTVPAGPPAGVLSAAGTQFADILCSHLYPMKDHNDAQTIDPSSDSFLIRLNADFVSTTLHRFAGYTQAQALTLPRIITEFGMSSSGGTPNGLTVDNATQAKSILNGILNAWNEGYQALCINTFYDQGDGFGIMASAGVPNLSGTYLHNFTTALKDPGSTAFTFTPGPLTYSLSGLPANGQSLLFQESNGVYDLIIWNNVANWTFAAGTPIITAPTNVTVNFNTAQPRIKIHDPTVSSIFTTQIFNTNSVTIALTDYPMIVKIFTGITNNPIASGSSFTLDTGLDSTTKDTVQKQVIAEPTGGTFITPMQQTGGSVTALSSGAIINPVATLTRPASVVSASVTATSASPCVFTWTGNPLVNGQSVVLGGTAVPAGFTAGTPYFVVGVSGNTFQLSTTFGGGAAGSSSTGTAVTATFVYRPGSLIASSNILLAAGITPSFSPSGVGPVVPFFSLGPGGGGIFPRVRVLTNVPGTLLAGVYTGSGWDNVSISINFWSAPPSYASADGAPYAVATGAANWLANYVVIMAQDGDGARGGGALTGANELALKLLSPASLVYVDIQILSQAIPVASQMIIVAPETLI
jgi:hypothetical protein